MGNGQGLQAAPAEREETFISKRSHTPDSQVSHDDERDDDSDSGCGTEHSGYSRGDARKMSPADTFKPPDTAPSDDLILAMRQITSLNGPAQVQKKTTIIQRSKTEMPRPDTIESGEVFTASPSQRKTSDGMSPKPPSIPKREDSSSSMDKDKNTEKTDKEKENDDTAAEDGDKDEKTDAPTRAISPKSMPSDLSPTSANLAASLFRYMGTVHLYVYKPDENGEQIKQAADVDIAFIEPLQEKHECPVCARVLRYPVQFEACSHRCCSSCLPELLRVAPRCPKDNKPVDRESVTVDKAFQREIEGLGVKCANHPAGCKWKGVLKEFYVSIHGSQSAFCNITGEVHNIVIDPDWQLPHYEDCKYLSIPCPRRCGAEFEKRFLDKHLKEDCPKRDMTCEFCKSTIAVDEEITHLNVCKRFPIPCPNGCKKKEIPREELDEHMESACTKQGIPCPFSECGCDFRCARKEMNKHIRDEPVKHLTLVGQTILAHKKTLEMHSEIMDSQNDKLEKAGRRVEGLEKLYGSQLIWKIDNYTAKLEEAKAGKKPTIFSPPFLTSRHGYKLAMSCCLYGDGKARGKHLSVFVCICKGEYDALLLWPFSHRVTFTLIDQCQDPEARRNVTYSVKPNTCKENKAFLGRPSGERNASFGAQKFCDLAVVDTLDYIRDDALFIKVNIEMDDMVML